MPKPNKKVVFCKNLLGLAIRVNTFSVKFLLTRISTVIYKKYLDFCVILVGLKNVNLEKDIKNIFS